MGHALSAHELKNDVDMFIRPEAFSGTMHESRAMRKHNVSYKSLMHMWREISMQGELSAVSHTDLLNGRHHHMLHRLLQGHDDLDVL